MARRLLLNRTTMPVDTHNLRPGSRPVRGVRAGFTLVELAVVVTIVGVLAVIAVVGYRKLTLSSKVTEAQTMISAIRVAQEDYKTERGRYADVGPLWCPSDGMLEYKTAWNRLCPGGGTEGDWKALAVHNDGALRFGYRTTSGLKNPGQPFGIPVTQVDFSGAPQTVPWYVVHAKADLSAGGVQTELVGSSFDGKIFVANEGE